MKLSLLTSVLFITLINCAFGQNYTEILGRPTYSAITISTLFDQKADVYWEYSTTAGSYTNSTSHFLAEKDIPLEIDFTNLEPDSKYFYRTRYRANGSATQFLIGAEHSFHTARPAGKAFTFAIEADPHLDTNSNPSSFTLTLQNILSAKPDFLIDLGDIFMSEKQPGVNQSIITNRHLLYRPYFNNVCHSVPLYLALGNHEGEAGWLLNGISTSVPVMTTNTRKLYYPNPVPDSFYTGDTISENFVGLREDYYAWEWGDALIIILDPYWHTVTRPDWGWTLGKDQYDWFKKTISNSKAKYKFVFCHHLVGGLGIDTRGGTEYADFFEMGGYNTDKTWGFDTNRPGWGKPIHQLMVENKATIFFHGHDHFFGKQEKDGIVYQEVPQPSNKNITNTSASKYGYVDGILLPGRGYLLVKVTDTSTKVDYIKTLLPNEENATRKNQDIAYSYSIASSTNGIEENAASQVNFELEQNFPNPFSKETTIHYSIPFSDHVQLKVYDIFGKEVATLINQNQQQGKYHVTFNLAKFSLVAGIYYYQLSVGNDSKSLKMIYVE